MSDTALKAPFYQALDGVAQGKVADAFQQYGQSLPCRVVAVTGAIVTVAFEIDSDFTLPQVSMPIAGSEYIRLPIQEGCLGVALSASASLGGISGLGTGTASLTPPSNLGALIFQPVGNKNWSEVAGDKLVMYGPAGATIQDEAATSIIAATTAGISMTFGGHSVVISASGVIIDGVPFLTHPHSGVTTGTGVTGPVVP